jgi:D-alanyl-D-alanine carboxypeptidase
MPTKAIDQTALDAIVRKTVKRNIRGAVLHVRSEDGALDLRSAAGDLRVDSVFYIASINKFMIAAITLRMQREALLNMDDPITKYLPDAVMAGLAVYNGHDHSNEITIRHLLSHTSGLPCYLIDKGADGKKGMDAMHRGEDVAWPAEKVLANARAVGLKFAPGTQGKASYGETNFRLIDMILERVTNSSMDVLLTHLFSDLGMKDTHVIGTGSFDRYAPVRHKENEIGISNYAAATRHEIASTTADLMLFLQAWTNGHFHPKERLHELHQWNSIFFPFKYGIGIQRFSVPRLLSPFQSIPEFIGHCGSVGSGAFHVPEKKVFIAGTVNQTSKMNALFQMMVKTVAKL